MTPDHWSGTTFYYTTLSPVIAWPKCFQRPLRISYNYLTRLLLDLQQRNLAFQRAPSTSEHDDRLEKVSSMFATLHESHVNPTLHQLAIIGLRGYGLVV
jgi:hypothetical protein